MHYTHLVLSAAGFRAFAFLGAIQALRDADLHRPVRHVAGCSGGAIAAFAFCVNADPHALATRCAASVRDRNAGIHVVGPVRLSAFREMWTEQGIARADNVERMLRDVLEESTSMRAMSMQDFAKSTGRELALWTTNLTQGCGQALTLETHPDLDIVTAILASMAIPLVYRPVTIGGDLMVDGAVTEFVPTSAFRVAGDHVLQVSLPPSPVPPGPGMGNLMAAVVCAAMRHGAVGENILAIDVSGAELDFSDLNCVRFNVTPETVWSQFHAGQAAAATWLASKNIKHLEAPLN